MLRVHILIIFAAIALVSVRPANAAVVDANIFYFTDGITADTDTSHAATLYNFFLGFDIDKRGIYQIGWNYTGQTTETKSDTDATKYSSTQMGPGVIIYMGKDRNFRFGFSYNLETISKYEAPGETEKEWRGTAMNADFGYQFRFEGVFSFGFRLNYSSMSAAESVEDTTKEDVSHKKTIIYPSVALTLDSF